MHAANLEMHNGNHARSQHLSPDRCQTTSHGNLPPKKQHLATRGPQTKSLWGKKSGIETHMNTQHAESTTLQTVTPLLPTCWPTTLDENKQIARDNIGYTAWSNDIGVACVAAFAPGGLTLRKDCPNTTHTN